MVNRSSELRTERFVTPSRDNSGVIIPEFILFDILRQTPEPLSKGSYNKGDNQEPIIKVTNGLTRYAIENTLDAFRSNPPKISFQFPEADERLPMITIVTESLEESERFLGQYGGDVREDIIEDTTASLLIDNAVGGETTASLNAVNVIPGMVDLSLVRGGNAIALNQSVGEYTVNATTGIITLETALQAGDDLRVDRWAKYGAKGGYLYSTYMRFVNVIFIATNNPISTSILTGIVWHTLIKNRTTLENNGLSNVEYARRSFSLWDERVPPIGFRAELTVAGYVEWLAFDSVDTLKNVNVIMNDENKVDSDADPLTSFTEGLAVWEVDTCLYED